MTSSHLAKLYSLTWLEMKPHQPQELQIVGFSCLSTTPIIMLSVHAQGHSTIGQLDFTTGHSLLVLWHESHLVTLSLSITECTVTSTWDVEC